MNKKNIMKSFLKKHTHIYNLLEKKPNNDEEKQNQRENGMKSE